MSIIRASELAYCRFQFSDLQLSHQFLHDFGLVFVMEQDGVRYYRGTDPHPYCYAVRQGPERFLGFGLNAKSLDDLYRLAAFAGRKVEAIDAPGGGWKVRLIEPNGYDVDVVYGIVLAEPIVIDRPLSNSVARPLARANELFRLRSGEPTPVRRLAHVVLGSAHVAATVQWFKDVLGLISSDDIVAGPDADLFGSFMRVDNGDDYVDHHSVFIMQNSTTGLQHVSFEAQDIDAVMHDHHYLKSLNRYEQLWGIGRHLLGSQLFDYWADPFGYAHEHWADTDRLNAQAPSQVHQVHEGLVNQWGEGATQRFRQAIKP